jgi:opacity protein-like surface antigen
VTGEYRGKANFHGLDITGGGTGTNEYRGSKSEWLVLANVYADLGTWYSFTPFIGAGIGASYVTISNFTDVNVPTAGVAFAADASKWNFAWAAHAGIAYQATPFLTLEFAYRYVHLGDGTSGDIVTYTGVNVINNPMEFRNLSSHDLKFGARWLMAPPIGHPPLMHRG